MIISKLPSSLLGGNLMAFMAVYNYLSVNTPTEFRSIRFAILEIFYFGKLIIIN